MLKLFNQCPSCGGPLVITECQCPACHLQLRGEFTPGQFSAFSNDQLTFIRAFLKARGNLSELEKVLGVSYPTIRNKLDEIISLLDRTEIESTSVSKNMTSQSDVATRPDEALRKSILAQVAAGEIPAEEGLARLQKLQGGK